MDGEVFRRDVCVWCCEVVAGRQFSWRGAMIRDAVNLMRERSLLLSYATDASVGVRVSVGVGVDVDVGVAVAVHGFAVAVIGGITYPHGLRVVREYPVPDPASRTAFLPIAEHPSNLFADILHLLQPRCLPRHPHPTR